ncbi:MAG: hypothetical protein ACFE9R_20490, partial [Candidatus Hermodarchaeota archaeon]
KKIHLPICFIWSWLGKNVTTLFYVIIPILISLGFGFTGIEVDDFSSVITEAFMLMLTLAVMQFILSFNWEKYLNNRRAKRKA